jgi:hypothetical protein
MIMLDKEPQKRETPDDPNQTSTPSKNSGSGENSRFRRREPDRSSGSVTGENTDLQEKGDVSEEGEPSSERSTSQQRHHRGGRQEKRIIEESAYDPYCE